MNYIFCDLDCTLVDTAALVASGGPEPTPGTVSHDQWRQIVTEPGALAGADVVYPVFRMIQFLADANLFFLTNRRESNREVTKAWLDAWGFYDTPLLMRPDDELTRAGEFKAGVILEMTLPEDSVLVIDDDPDGSLETVCRDNGWTHLKVTTYK